jgi:hypothetical protein
MWIALLIGGCFLRSGRLHYTPGPMKLLWKWWRGGFYRTYSLRVWMFGWLD